MTAVFRHEMQLLFSGLTAYVYGAFCLFFVGVYMMYYNIRKQLEQVFFFTFSNNLK